MTEREKAKILELWHGGMPLARIRQIVYLPTREFRTAIKELKQSGAMMKIKRVSREDKIIASYERGERNPYKIAEDCGVSLRTVQYYLSANKLPLGKNGRKCGMNFKHCEKTERIFADFERGELKQIEIARKYGVSKEYISKMRKKWRAL